MRQGPCPQKQPVILCAGGRGSGHWKKISRVVRAVRKEKTVAARRDGYSAAWRGYGCHSMDGAHREGTRVT